MPTSKGRWKVLYNLERFIVLSPDIRPPDQLQTTCDENQFQRDLEEAKRRTSSPINLRSFIQNSVHMDINELQERHSGPLPDLRG